MRGSCPTGRRPWPSSARPKMELRNPRGSTEPSTLHSITKPHHGWPLLAQVVNDLHTFRQLRRPSLVAASAYPHDVLRPAGPRTLGVRAPPTASSTAACIPPRHRHSPASATVMTPYPELSPSPASRAGPRTCSPLGQPHPLARSTASTTSIPDSASPTAGLMASVIALSSRSAATASVE